MAKKSINKKHEKRKNSKIKSEVTILKDISYDEHYARVGFSKVCNQNCLLSEWHGNELKDLIDCFKKLESKTWKEIKKDKGLKYKMITKIAIPPPKILPPDARLSSIRVCSKKRLYGYRVENCFYIIWFDKNHRVCPEDKRKEYSIGS